jgi:hypothetical protein
MAGIPSLATRCTAAGASWKFGLPPDTLRLPPPGIYAHLVDTDDKVGNLFDFGG